ncbi:MAG TPA: VOC family protein [Bacillales bacterium]|nr:VOC family protein [Bacillales bacterium]
MKRPQISKIATIEIPVSQLERSIKWYTEILDLNIHHHGEKNAMLGFKWPGSATLYLVETYEQERLSFLNTNTGVTHSVIDFYTSDLKGLYNYLKEQNVEVGTLNVNPADPTKPGGFGFKDPDGNLLSACNVDHDALLFHEQKADSLTK